LRVSYDRRPKVPRFVILEHDHPTRHWDLMLETADALRTWRLAAPPSPGNPVAAMPLGNHRKQYLDYEGPVSGGRGTVRRWDRGVYDRLCDSDGLTCFRLAGERTRGRCTIEIQPGGDCLLAFAPDTN
jgi:hypothetical protein